MSTYKPDVEMLGGISLTTTPWQVKLAQKIFEETGEPKMKNWWGWNSAQGWNVSLINRMVKHSKASLLSGAKMDIYLKANAGVSLEAAQSFIRNLSAFVGKDVREGIGAAVATALEKTIQGAGETAEAVPKVVPLVLVVLAGGIAAYLTFAGKKGTKLTPW